MQQGSTQPELLDSRRLTGINLLFAGPGAVIDVGLPAEDRHAFAKLWRQHLEATLHEVGWAGASTAVRLHPEGVSLGFQAPIDALYVATEINEFAWRRALAEWSGEPSESSANDYEPLRREIAKEENPRAQALLQEARQRGVPGLFDDDELSVGYGVHSRTWPAQDLPAPADVPWEEIRSLPVALITGTNGKTTTVRLLAAIARAAGKTPGFSSTDGIWVGDEMVDSGDYSGPGGARAVLRHRDVEFPILETARGGMLRRGLGVERAEVVAITNVAADHLGEWGVHDLGALANTKALVLRALDAAGCAILNAEDPEVLSRADQGEGDRVWFGIRHQPEWVREHIEAGGEAWWLDGDELTFEKGAEQRVLASARQIPVTLGGAAKHNIANCLTAAAIAYRLGVDLESIARGLQSFESTPEANPGRTNWMDLGGLNVLVDFAHNPHGMESFFEMAKELPGRRRGIVIGQAGDRDNESILALARITAEAKPDLVLIKEMEVHLRGRERGEVPHMMEEELLRAGTPANRIVHSTSELAAVRELLEWAEAGDLLLLPLHAQRNEVLALLDDLRQRNWSPGQSLDS